MPGSLLKTLVKLGTYCSRLCGVLQVKGNQQLLFREISSHGKWPTDR